MNYTHRRDFSTYARAGGTVYTCAYAAERATPWLGSLEGWCSIVVLAGLERGRNRTYRKNVRSLPRSSCRCVDVKL